MLKYITCIYKINQILAESWQTFGATFGLVELVFNSTEPLREFCSRVLQVKV